MIDSYVQSIRNKKTPKSLIEKFLQTLRGMATFALDDGSASTSGSCVVEAGNRAGMED